MFRNVSNINQPAIGKTTPIPTESCETARHTAANGDLADPQTAAPGSRSLDWIPTMQRHGEINMYI